jgi:hypothetical protein
MRIPKVLEPGSKLTLRWDSGDDRGIVSLKIRFYPVADYGSFQEVATLSPDQRTFEWTVPDIGFQNNGPESALRFYVTDTTGKEGNDEARFVIPTNTIEGNLTFHIEPGQTFRPGDAPDRLVTPEGIDRYMTQLEGGIVIEGRTPRKLQTAGVGGIATNEKFVYGQGMPFLSTDTARYVIAFGDTANRRKYWYSPFFKIRPDPRLGDAPPTITLLSPQKGQVFPPAGQSRSDGRPPTTKPSEGSTSSPRWTADGPGAPS